MKTQEQKWGAPLLITGCARTGTSALARLLSRHPRICIFNEYHLYYKSKEFCNVWHRIRGMTEDNPPPDCISDDSAAMVARLERDLPSPVPCTEARKWLFDQASGILEIYGDKMPYKYLCTMNTVADHFPKAKFLITVRDGRDVVASQILRYHEAVRAGNKPEHWMQPTVEKAEYLWLQSARTWLELRPNPPLPCLEVRYEQATRDPTSLARSICEFTGMNYREEEFRTFARKYRPVHVAKWQEEGLDLENRLSSEFLDALEQLGYS